MPRQSKAPEIELWNIPVTLRNTANKISSVQEDELLGRNNMYSALTEKRIIDNKAYFVTPLEAIEQEYAILSQPPPSISSMSNKHKSPELQYGPLKRRVIKSPSPMKLARIHLNDTTLASERSFIEKSDSYNSDKNLKSYIKDQRLIRRNMNLVKYYPEINILNDKLPKIKNVYPTQLGLESRMNSFTNENLSRLKLFKSAIPMCELSKTQKAIHKASTNGKTPTLTPQNTFIGSYFYDGMNLKDRENMSKLGHPVHQAKTFSNKIHGLEPVERHNRTFFCEVLGEKYCSVCIECHERRFAKIYEKKYIKLSKTNNELMPISTSKEVDFFV